jgi:hypothetical protein
MGHATGNTLKDKGVISYALTDSFDEIGLVRAVMRLTTI